MERKVARLLLVGRPPTGRVRVRSVAGWTQCGIATPVLGVAGTHRLGAVVPVLVYGVGSRATWGTRDAGREGKPKIFTGTTPTGARLRKPFLLGPSLTCLLLPLSSTLPNVQKSIMGKEKGHVNVVVIGHVDS